MKAVYPPGMMPPPEPEKKEEQRQAEVQAKVRDHVFAALSQSPDFRVHVLEGWLAEEEARALTELENCESPKVVAKREAWTTLKQLRARLKDELEESHQRILAAEAAEKKAKEAEAARTQA